MAYEQTARHADWLRRPVFRDPDRYSPERFNRISEYHAARLRHALLGIAGPGVIYGFAVETDADGCCRVKKGAINVSCGLAIDRCGRMLYWPGGWVSVERLAGVPPDSEGPYTLFAHHAERPVGVDGSCGCEKQDAAWVEECVVFSLQCGCERCEPDCPELCRDCISTNDYVCGRTGSDDNGIPADPSLSKICIEPGELCDVACGDWLYDHASGIPLACVDICEGEGKLKGRECGPEYIFCCTEPRVCGHRDYVYRNPLLYELIRGCQYELTRIARLNIEGWLRRGFDAIVPFNEFARLLAVGFTVEFSRPILKSTLHPASVFITAVVREQDSFFHDVLRLPTEPFEFLRERDGYAEGVRLTFPKQWIANQVGSELSRFNFGGIIELTVRCSMLRDECGCMPDARPLPDVRPAREEHRIPGTQPDAEQKPHQEEKPYAEQPWPPEKPDAHDHQPKPDECDEPCPLDKTAQQMPGDEFIVAFCVDRRPVSDSKDYPGDTASTY